MTRFQTVITAALVALAATAVTFDTTNAASNNFSAGPSFSSHTPNDPGTPGSNRPNKRRTIACAPKSNCDEVKVCFYTLPNFRGKSFCEKSSTNVNRLSATWNDRISSVKVYGTMTKICSDENQQGKCILIGSPRTHLNSLDNAISSISIR